MNKFQIAQELLQEHYKNNIVINLSPCNGYRSRVEFGYKNNFYTMYDLDGDIVYLDRFNVARPSINTIMPLLLSNINKSPILKDKLFQVNFRTNNENRILTSMIYHKKLDREIKDEAIILSNKLHIDINLRSRKDIFSTGDKLLKDKLKNRNINLYQTDQSFYQPNHFHMPKMVQKASDFIKEPKDLLELYCGSGTFTLPLARIFRNVIATENNRQSIKCLNKSINEHSIKNVFHFRLSAEEVADALEGRIFKRMGKTNIKDFNFSHILVDPPRSGLTEDVINLLNKFQNIIYISCNQHTYARDLDLLNNFTISHIEFFDQFPNTNHLEIVSLLTKK